MSGEDTLRKMRRTVTVLFVGSMLFGIGASLNSAVESANGGKMPIVAAGMPAPEEASSPRDRQYIEIGRGARLAPLGDIWQFPLADRVIYFSVGDAFLALSWPFLIFVSIRVSVWTADRLLKIIREYA